MPSSECTFLVLLFLFQFTFSAGVGHFWQITDPHVDKLYAPGSDPDCDLTICCRNTSSTQKRKAGEWGDFGYCDIPPKTFQSALDFVKNYPVDADFILYGGDNIVHDDWDQSREYNLGYAKFVRDMMYNTFGGEAEENMSSSNRMSIKRGKREAAAKVRIFPTIGNHDVFPCDQLDFPPHSSWFLEPVSAMYGTWLSESAVEMFRYFGYYSELIRPGLRLITLNTQYEDPINFYLYKNLTDPGDQWSWLSRELAAAERAGEKVYIFGHIPPGICDRDISPSWIPTFTQVFAKIVERYSKTIVFQTYGHTHQDSFRLFWNSNHTEVVGVGFITPSVSTFEVQNPSVRLFKYDLDTFELVDMLTFYANLTEANKVTGELNWKLEYSSKEAYQMKDLTPSSWYEVWKKMDQDQTYWKLFDTYYHASNVLDCANGEASCKTGQICSIGNVDYDHYRDCLKQHERMRTSSSAVDV